MLKINEKRKLEVEFKQAFEHFFKKGSENYEAIEEGAQFDIDMSRCDSVGCFNHIIRMQSLIDCYKKEMEDKKWKM